jgi:hypothetical protein
MGRKRTLQLAGKRTLPVLVFFGLDRASAETKRVRAACQARVFGEPS